jgi:hypothetical protein
MLMELIMFNADSFVLNQPNVWTIVVINNLTGEVFIATSKDWYLSKGLQRQQMMI